MPRLFPAALTVVFLLAGRGAADDKNAQNDSKNVQPAQATITKVDANKGEITLRSTDAQGKAHDLTFHLADDVRIADETGRVIKLEVFKTGDEVLIVKTGDRLRELRRAPHLEQTLHLSDSVRTLIEFADREPSEVAELQKIYDMLRPLDTGKNGKLDPSAVHAEANKLLEERVKTVFNRLDTNHTGKITREQARGLIKEHFDQIDTNHKGYITLDELMKAARAMHAQHAEEHPAARTPPPSKEKK